MSMGREMVMFLMCRNYEYQGLMTLAHWFGLRYRSSRGVKDA